MSWYKGIRDIASFKDIFIYYVFIDEFQHEIIPCILIIITIHHNSPTINIDICLKIKSYVNHRNINWRIFKRKIIRKFNMPSINFSFENHKFYSSIKIPSGIKTVNNVQRRNKIVKKKKISFGKFSHAETQTIYK